MLMLMAALEMRTLLPGKGPHKQGGGDYSVLRTQHFISQRQLTARCAMTAELREKEREGELSVQIIRESAE